MALSMEVIEQRFETILLRIEEGEALRQILKTIPMSASTFYEWLESSDSMAKRYARACEMRAELKFESIEQDYSETPQRDPETGRIDSAWVNLQRLKIDAKKWELAKMIPKKYGEKQETTHIFEKPIFTGINLDVPENNSPGEDSGT